MRKGATKPVEFPDHQVITRSQVIETGLEARTIVARSGSFILMKMTLIDARREQRIALEIDGLTVIGGL